MRLVALLLLCLAAPASAEVSERLTLSRYRVEPEDAEALSAALNRATPFRRFFGRRFHGNTAWQVRWTFSWDETPEGRCALTKLDTELASDITLPELIGGSVTTRQRFETYLEALREHEMGHHRIAQAAAQRIDQAIRLLPPQADCDTLKTAVHRAGERELDGAREEERRYDDQTRYGRTQGAWLP